MTFTLQKQVDGEWYTYGNYTVSNLETLCMAYGECARVADDVRIVTKDASELVTCAECRHRYFKDFNAYCPNRVGALRSDGYCERGERK